MNRKDIKELHFITPIENVPSILKYGILSHKLSKRLPHDSVAMQEIQDRRKNKKIPGTDKYIHDHANLYFDAHNATLSKLRSKNNEICILQISPEILDLRGVIISDRNAARDWARFYPAQEGLATLDKDLVYAVSWKHPDNQYEEMEHKSIKGAETLVPDKVEPKYILGAYVANQTALAAFNKLKIELTAEIKSGIFF
ncbi:MAG: DUF4433 domain-containing protein [Sedimentisphaerales bacterium]